MVQRKPRNQILESMDVKNNCRAFLPGIFLFLIIFFGRLLPVAADVSRISRGLAGESLKTLALPFYQSRVCAGYPEEHQEILDQMTNVFVEGSGDQRSQYQIKKYETQCPEEETVSSVGFFIGKMIVDEASFDEPADQEAAEHSGSGIAVRYHLLRVYQKIA